MRQATKSPMPTTLRPQLSPESSSNWGTSFFVTASDVTITGLDFVAAAPGGTSNKAIEVVEDNFTLAYSVVGSVGGDIGSTIYINDDVATSNPGFVSDIATFNIHNNILQGDFVLTNGPGMNLLSTSFVLLDNEFVRNPGSSDDYNWGVIITGQDDAVAWRPASLGGELVATGNSFSADYTTDRLLYVRDDDATKLPDAQFVEDFIADNNIDTYAYATDPLGVPSVVDLGTTFGFVLAKSAGNGSSYANAGDTLIVKTNGAPATETIVTNDLHVDALSADLDLELGGGVITLSLAGGGQNTDVTGNAENNVINGNAGDNSLAGGDGNDTLTGGEGDDVIDGGAGVDTAVFADGEIAIDGSGHWTVTISDDINVLSGVEKVQIGSETYLLVDKQADGGFSTIQEAVDAATGGETILVAGGTYKEQVTIDGVNNLTIRELAGEDVIIQSPDDLVETGRSASDREIHAIVQVTDAANVVLDGIEIDGNGKAATIDEADGAGQAGFYGVVYRNASGELLDVDIHGIRDVYAGGTTADGFPVVSGAQRGVGLMVDNDTLLSFTMTGGSIYDFQKNATVFNQADLDVSGVTITGGGAQTIIAQNGIQVMNSTGSIDDNTIQAIGYAGPQVVYAGLIPAYDNTDLAITGNTITGSNAADLNSKVVGVFVLNNGGVVSGGEITGNTISYVDDAIDLWAEVEPNQVLIENNTISNVDWADPYAEGVGHYPDPAVTTVFDVEGSGGTDYLYGASGDDTLTGLDGDDTLSGGAGTDTTIGGDGDDYHVVDSATDVVVETSGGGDDTVEASVSYTLAGGVEVEHLVATDGAGPIDLTGNEFGQTITGNASDNTLTGGAGDDDIDGGAGIDTAVFAGTLTATDFAASGSWNVASSADGTDHLTNVEVVVDGSNNRFLLVGSDGFATLAEAIAEARDGDTILLADGVYDGNVVIDKAVTI